jgi:hypothetical protein
MSVALYTSDQHYNERSIVIELNEKSLSLSLYNISYFLKVTVISGVRLVNRTGAALGIYMVLGVFRTYSEHCGLLAQLASVQA